MKTLNFPTSSIRLWQLCSRWLARLLWLSLVVVIALISVLLFTQLLDRVSSTAIANARTDIALGHTIQEKNINSTKSSSLFNHSYATATVLLEDTGETTVELSSALDKLGSFSILSEGSTYSLWLNSYKTTPLPREGIEQRLESQDGLVWRNRTDTNLVLLNSDNYKFLRGARDIIKSSNTYQGWEEYYYEWSLGWAHAIRYITSTNGITWTVVNQPSLIGAIFPNLIEEGGIYHMWIRIDVDERLYPGEAEVVRYRTSTDGGSGWGDWRTGGQLVTVDDQQLMALSRVRQSSDDTMFQLFYIADNQVHLATSANGITFTTQVTPVLDLAVVLPDIRGVKDFAVVDVAGHDWFYFVYSDHNGVDHIAVSRPEHHVYLPIAMRNHTSPVAFPLHVGDTISVRDVARRGEIFYINWLQIPDEIPNGGHFYFSSQRDSVASVLVDDELAVLVDGIEVFTYDFSTSGHPEAAIVEVPRTTLEQLAGRIITIEYRDVYGMVVQASTIWLIWMP